MCVVTAGEQTNTDWSRICQGKTLVGRIHAILERVENTAGDTIHAVSIEAYTLVNSRHPHFGMPELRGTDERPLHVVLPLVRHLSIVSLVQESHSDHRMYCVS